jgi:hypothetical protein
MISRIALRALLPIAVTGLACQRAPEHPPATVVAEVRRELDTRGRTDQAVRRVLVPVVGSILPKHWPWPARIQPTPPG